ncbi:MAG: hypothetical protein EPO02_13410 [Nitrospirae bacterium]|nr:MAG: hypothetical protein EPO02_13410 [Nitrospirota bacterium]
MSDILGEQTALTQARAIIAQIPSKELSKKVYKQLVQTIYDQQLKKFTKLNRNQRHIRCKELFKKPNRGGTGVAEPPALLSKRALHKVLNESQGNSQESREVV